MCVFCLRATMLSCRDVVNLKKQKTHGPSPSSSPPAPFTTIAGDRGRWTIKQHRQGVDPTQPHLLTEAAEGRTAHNNGWNRAYGMASNTRKPCVWCIWYHSTYSAPAITTSPSSPIKVPPTFCATYTQVLIQAVSQYNRQRTQACNTQESPVRIQSVTIAAWENNAGVITFWVSDCSPVSLFITYHA